MTQSLLIGSKIPATLLVSAGDGPTLIANVDQVNTIYIGDNYAILATDPTQVSPLGPQATLVVNGEKDVYGICLSGQTAACDVITGGISFFLRLISLVLPLGATTGARIVLDGTKGAIFLFNSSNQLIGSWSPTAGTISGQSYPADLMSQSLASNRRVRLGEFFIEIDSTNPATLTSSGFSLQLIDATTVSAQPIGVIASPEAGAGKGIETILVEGQSNDSTKTAFISLQRSNANSTFLGPSTAHLEFADATGGIPTEIGFVASGDTVYRFTIDINGKMQWGPGNAALDTDLYRSSAGVVSTDGTFKSSPTSLGAAFAALIAGDTQSRFVADSNGKLTWGPGNAATDTDLFRNGVGALKTDSSLEVVGAIVGDSTVTGINITAETMTSATQQFTLASAVAVTGLSAALVPGTYDVEYELFWVPSGVIGSNHTHSFAFTGTATAGAYNAVSWQAQAANGIQQNASFTTGVTFPVALVNSPTHVGFPGWTRVKSRIVVSVAGTLTPTITLGTAGDDVTTQPGSSLKVTRIA